MHAHTPPFTKPLGAYDAREAAKPDPVTKPAHYQRAGIETIDYIRATLDAPGFEAYCIGNVLKYVSRYREKGGVEDLRKAQVYLGWAIDPKPAENNAAAMREAKIAYDMAFEDDAWDKIAKAAVNLGCGGLNKDVPGASHLSVNRLPEWASAVNLADSAHIERIPKWDPAWVKPAPAACQHPLNAEAIRDHDERLAGGEDRL